MKSLWILLVTLPLALACGQVGQIEQPPGQTGAITAGSAFTGAQVIRPTSGSCVQVLGEGIQTGGAVVEMACVYDAGQRWNFTLNSDGTYQISNGLSGLCVDVTGGSTQPGAGIQQWTCQVASANQHFTATPLKNGSFNLVAKNSGLCIDTQAQPFGTQLTQQTCTQSTSQQFAILSLAKVANAPWNLLYAQNPAVLTKDQAMPVDLPHHLGGPITGYSVSPALPPGLSLNTSTGVVSGTPVQVAPQAAYTVTGANAEGTTSVALEIQINDVKPSNLGYAQNPLIAVQSVAIAPDAPTSSGGPVVSYSISPGLPAGLAFDSGTGIVSGNPIAFTGNTSYTVTASNSGGSTQVNLNLSVASLGGGAFPVPANGNAYFGGWINPEDNAGTQEEQTEDIEVDTLGRKLALHMHYHNWSDDFATLMEPGGELAQDLQYGRTPVMTWSCNPLNSAVAASVNGDAIDQVIVKAAQAFASYKVPVLLRWNWEMNLKDPANPSVPNRKKCMDPSKDEATNASDFQAAWARIHQRFADTGATNVSWLWNPGGAASDPDPMPYYPASNSLVDWVGFDGYDKHVSPTADFQDVFAPFYEEFASKEKPILIGETGECEVPGAQQHYLSTAATEIGTAPFLFPQVKGFMYFDAAGSYTHCINSSNWVFDADGLTGFAQMGQLPFFNP